MSSNQNWSDRRGLFQKGKELHEPTSPTGRKFSETGVTNAVRRASTSSNSDKNSAPDAFPTSGRRRSSAGSGLFNNLNNMKRGGEEYGERRTSQQEMMGSGGGIVSGWFNQTFKGHQKPAENNQK